MNGHQGPSSADADDLHLNDPRVRAWFAEHQSDLRQSIATHRIQRQILAAGFMLGLVAHVAGYLLRSSASGEPIGLAADLLYAFGFALWTGAVVVVFVQLIPEAKEQQFRRALEAYESTKRRKAPARAERS